MKNVSKEITTITGNKNRNRILQGQRRRRRSSSSSSSSSSSFFDLISSILSGMRGKQYHTSIKIDAKRQKYF
jgi:hypothetical protein